MKTTAGLWIDHRKAVIALLSEDGEETLEIQSNVEKQPGRLAGVRLTTPYESQKRPADGLPVEDVVPEGNAEVGRAGLIKEVGLNDRDERERGQEVKQEQEGHGPLDGAGLFLLDLDEGIRHT